MMNRANIYVMIRSFALALLGIGAAASIYLYNWNPETGLETMKGAVVSSGPLPTFTGCGNHTQSVGGSFAGMFNTDTTMCDLTITFNHPAPHGWMCQVKVLGPDAIDSRFIQMATTPNSCTEVGKVRPGDLIIWRTTGF